MASASSIITTEDQRHGVRDGTSLRQNERTEEPVCLRTGSVSTSWWKPCLCSGLETSFEGKYQ
jgi:hypothetical protein